MANYQLTHIIYKKTKMKVYHFLNAQFNSGNFIFIFVDYVGYSLKFYM